MRAPVVNCSLMIGKNAMCRKLLSLILAILLISLNGLTLVKGQESKDKAEAIKSKIAKFGVGPKVNVVVKLEDGETVKGYVSSIAEDSFVVERQGNRGSEQIAYGQVKDVRKKHAAGYVIAAIGAAAGTTVGLLYLTGFLLSKCSPCVGG
jgi:hypothetical protein